MRYLTKIDLYETPSVRSSPSPHQHAGKKMENNRPRIVSGQRLYAIGQLGHHISSYRILKLDRTLSPPSTPCNVNSDLTPDQLGLLIHDDGTNYTRHQVNNVLNMLSDSNDSVKLIASKIVALFGIVRFVEQYYLIAVVQATEVASLGPHFIYRIDETRLISIANPALVKWTRNSDEHHYLSAFQTLALQQDLYLSLSYDLTRSLQHNILIQAVTRSIPSSPPETTFSNARTSIDSTCSSNPLCYLCSNCCRVARRSMGSTAASPHLRNDGMFTWNAHHLAMAALGLGISSCSSPDHPPSPWFVPIIQGFVGQVKLMVVGRPIFVTLIARRSRKYAGARFLRRGVDMLDGWVANEVESEQIVHDGAQTLFPDLTRTAQQRLRRSSRQSNLQHPTTPIITSSPPHEPAGHSPHPPSSVHQPRASLDAPSSAINALISSPNYTTNTTCPFCYGDNINSDGTVRTSYPPGPLPRMPMYTSFIQHRGSIPLIWSQDNSAMTPKPPITLNIRDPYFVMAGKHFNRMFEHYGSRVICFNLIKTREKSKREMILGEEFQWAVKYLSQFLGPGEDLQYHHVDMSREAKAGRVIDVLEQHAEAMVDQIGFFSSGPEPVLQARLRDNGDYILARVQNGVIRTNCIDCLDRTNTAAFMIGKCALGRQLMQLGVLKSPIIPFDTEAIDLLTELYQEHGDSIALQYGGSALVNTMKTYRDRTFISQSRDMLESAKRYWSNSFSDADKQDAIDIFLGVFERWGDFRSGHVPVELRLSPGPFNYTQWRIPNNDPTLGSSECAGEDKYPEPCQLISLSDIYGAGGCVVSQSATPFKPHAPRTETMFDLSGLKKWLSVRETGPLFSRERSSTGFSTIMSASEMGKMVTFDSMSDTFRVECKASEKNAKLESPTTGSSTPFQSGTRTRTKEGMDRADSMTTTNVGSPVVGEADTGPVKKSSNKKKKAMEAQCAKLLAPEVSSGEMREYRRYVNQFLSGGIESRMLETGCSTGHPDYAIFQRHVKLGTGCVGPVVLEDDESLFQAYVDVPAKVMSGAAVDHGWQQRIAAYETWVATGRLKPGNGPAAKGGSTAMY